MPSVHITPIEVYKAIRTIVAAMYSDDLAQTGKQPNSFAIIRNEGDLSGDTLNNRPEHYYTDLFYTRGYNGSGNMFAQFPRVVLQEFTAPSLDGGSAFDVALMCADLAHDNTIDASGLAVRHFKEVEENTRSILMAIYRNLLSWEKRISPDGTEVYFAPALQMTGTFESWRVRDTMQQVLRSNERVSFRRTIEGMFTQATAGNVMNLTLNIRNYECQQVAYANPCSGGSSFELDVNGETVTISDNYTLEILQDGELIGTGVLGENSGTWTIPPCPTPDPVTVDVNGAEVEAEAGETVTVNVTRNGVPIGDITVTGLIVDVDIPICDPCEDVTVTLNGDEVATVEAGNPLELTTTLNGVLHPATYSAGTINLDATIPTQSGIVYRRQTPTQGDIYEANDTGTKFQAGFYNPTNVPYPVSFARLDPADPSRSTLLDNNKHGNKERFTLPSGAVPDGLYNVAATHSGGAISVYVVEDHYLGCCWVGWNTTAAFTANLTLIASLNVTGIGTGLAPLCDGGVQDIQVANGAAVSNLLVDNGFIAATYWTGLTSPVTTTQGYRMQTASQGISVQSKSSANRGIAFKFF